LLAGRKLETENNDTKTTITPEEIIALQQESKLVDLSSIRQVFVDVIHNLRTSGINVSDRRAVKLQNLIAASALMCDRTEAITTDLWVLKYIWDSEEQIEILEGIINNVIENEVGEQTHPQALKNKVPNPEEIIKEVRYLSDKLNKEGITYEEQNVIKDKLRFVQNRCDWITNPEQKEYIKNEIETLWQKILQIV